MCHTRVMRYALIFLLCASVFAQAPGTLDPARQNASKPDDDFKINLPVNVVIVPTTVRNRNGDVIETTLLKEVIGSFGLFFLIVCSL